MIAKIALAALGVILFILIFVFVFSDFFKANRLIDGTIDSFGQIYDQATADANNTNDKIQTSAFNSKMEVHAGTQYGLAVSRLLDTVIENIKKNPGHSIIVTYGATSTVDTDKITALKKEIEQSAQYEVSLDYDSHGYINKITISEY